MTRKKTYSRLLIVFIASCLIVGLLGLNIRRPGDRTDGFKRLFISHPLGITHCIDVGFNSYYIAGFDSGRIYLGNRTATRFVLATDYFLGRRDSLRLIVPDSMKRFPLTCTVSDSQIFLTDGNTNTILQTTLPDLKMKKSGFRRIPFFTAFLPDPNGAALLRTYNERPGRSSITKLSHFASDVKNISQLLEAAGDGFYASDGTLCQDAVTGDVVYVYRYRNLFVRMDTTLAIRLKSQTIDTISQARLEIGSYASGLKNITSFSSPPFAVNTDAYVSDGLLYVHSNLRAENESQKAFNKYAVLDVYKTDNGQYQFSLYLPQPHDHPIQCFAVRGRKLYTLADRYLSMYKLNF